MPLHVSRPGVAALCVATLFFATFCTTGAAAAGIPAPAPALILYYSRTGNTRMVCQEVAAALSIPAMEIRDLKNRTSGLGIVGGMFRTLFGMHTPIEPAQVDLNPYSVLIICSPIWASRVTPAVRTLIETNDLSGKRVVLLVTCDSFLAEKYQRRNAVIVEKAGGTVAGFFQVQFLQEQNGDKKPRPANEVLEDVRAMQPELRALIETPPAG